MAEEKQTPQCCVVICCDDKSCTVLKCDSDKAKELLAQIKECCDDGTDCCS